MKKICLTICLFIVILSSGFAQPTVNIVPFAAGFPDGISDIATAGDSRLFVVEQLGYISIVDTAGNVAPRLFLDIKNKVTPTVFSAGNEQGLLGLAFSPNYATDGYFYVNYTNKTGTGNTVIARYQVSSDPDSADVASEQILLTITQPFSNHNGGCLKFGNDGYLYIGLGDGGSAGDPGNRAQNTNELLGKILRIDVSGGGAYSIPPTNPFVLGGGAPEVWAYGVRNPWRFSFDRVTTDLWIADVGQNTWEEVNFQPYTSTGGENYGWRCYEGNTPYNTTGCGPIGSYVAPVHAYSHATSQGCSVTGGFVYRGANYPDLNSYYFFADYCNGKIYWISTAFTSGLAGTFTGKNWTTFGENNVGELFVASHTNGTVYRMVSTFVSVEEMNDAVGSFILTPNPSDGDFTVELNMKKSTNASISVADVTGRVDYNESRLLTEGRNSFQIDMSQSPAGIYFIKLTTPEGVLHKRAVITR